MTRFVWGGGVGGVAHLANWLIVRTDTALSQCSGRSTQKRWERKRENWISKSCYLPQGAATCKSSKPLLRLRLKLLNKGIIHKTPARNQALALARDVSIPLIDLLKTGKTPNYATTTDSLEQDECALRAITEDLVAVGAMDVSPDAIAILRLANEHAFLVVVDDRVGARGISEDELAGGAVVVVGKRGIRQGREGAEFGGSWHVEVDRVLETGLACCVLVKQRREGTYTEANLADQLIV